VAEYEKIFKACDIRGIVPDELDESVGAAFARLTDAAAVVTVHDMRTSSAPLADAFGRGAASQGADVIAAGLGSTDMLSYASGSLDIPGAMITASHNPARYNGIKLCRAGARPVGAGTGLADLRKMAADGVAARPGPGRTVAPRDLLSGYSRPSWPQVPTSAWPLTAMPTGVSWSTNGARVALGPDRLDRGSEAGQGALVPRSSITSSPRGRSPRSCPNTAASRSGPGSAIRSSRLRWPRPERSSAASTLVISASATSGSPTRDAPRGSP
jgi:hypothetical protein